MKRAQRRASLPGTDLGTDRRRRPGLRSAAAIVLAAGLTSGLAACGDDEDDGLDDVDVNVTTDMGSDDTGVAPGTDMTTDTMTDLTTGGTASGDSATVTTPVSGSVSNDDGGNGGTSAP